MAKLNMCLRRPDSNNVSNLWGPSEYDVRQALVVNYLYAVPYFVGQHNLAGEALGGFKPVTRAEWEPTTTPGWRIRWFWLRHRGRVLGTERDTDAPWGLCRGERHRPQVAFFFCRIMTSREMR
jgi:hypothetical protein